MEDYVQIPVPCPLEETLEMKVEFQMLGNKQQVVWASFKMWVTLKMSVGFF